MRGKDRRAVKMGERKGKKGARAPVVERAVQWIVNYRLPLAAALLGAAMVMGFIGNMSYLAAEGEVTSWWDLLYYTLRLVNPATTPVAGPLNNEIRIARMLGAVAGFYIAIEALLSIFRDQVQSLRVRGMRGHTVICGLGEKGLLLADSYRAEGAPVVVIESDRDNHYIGHCIDKGTVVLRGNAADAQLLRKARILRASRLITVCGEDGINAEVALQSRQIVEGRRGKALACMAHITDRQLWAMLGEMELRVGRPDIFRLGFFNIYESGARAMLYDYPFQDRPDHAGGVPHILVVGMGHLGTSLAVNAARRWRDSGSEGKLIVSIIDREAGRKVESLLLAYPRMSAVCSLCSLEMDIDSPGFERGDFLKDDKGGPGVVYVCLGDETAALTAALKIRRRVRPSKIPVVVRMATAGGLSRLLGTGQGQGVGDDCLYAFPLLETACTPASVWGGSVNEMLARAIHDEYLRNAAIRGETAKTNPSMVPWDNLPAALQESSRNQAEYITDKLRAYSYDFDMVNDWEIEPLRFSAEEVEGMAMMEHTRFVRERLRDGWKPGPVKDAARKISPTLIPWEMLSDMEKDKDRELVRGIPAFLAAAGYSLRRTAGQAPDSVVDG